MQVTPRPRRRSPTRAAAMTFEVERPRRPRDQHPLRHLPPARPARPLRRQRDRRAGRLQRGPRERRQVGRGGARDRGHPLPRDPRLRRAGAREARRVPRQLRRRPRPPVSAAALTMLVAWVALPGPARRDLRSAGGAARSPARRRASPGAAGAGGRLRGDRRRRPASSPSATRPPALDDPGRRRAGGARLVALAVRSPRAGLRSGGSGRPPPCSRLRRADRALGRADDRRLHQASTTPRPGWRSPTGCIDHGRDLGGLAPSTLRGDARLQPRRRLSGRRLHPVRGRRRSLLGDGPRLADPALHGVAGGAARRWPCGRWRGRSPGRPPCARAIAFIAAQPALLYGYYLWGGVKEVAAAALIAGAAPLASRALAARARRGAGSSLAAVLVARRWSGCSSAGGADLARSRRSPARRSLARPRARGRACGAGAPVGLGAGVAAPQRPGRWSPAALLPPTSSPLTDAAARGNLIGPSSRSRSPGSGPRATSGSTRSPSCSTYVLIGDRRSSPRSPGSRWPGGGARSAPLVYVVGSARRRAGLCLLGSPWVDGKALATASPAIPFAAMLAVGGWLIAGRRRGARALGGGGRRRRAVVERARLPRRQPRAARPARRARARSAS